MSEYPKNSMGEAEEKSHKLYTVIVIIAAIVLHVAVYFASANKFGIVGKYHITALLPIAFVVYLVISSIAVLKDKNWITRSPWPYIGLIILAAASALTIGYCPQC